MSRTLDLPIVTAKAGTETAAPNTRRWGADSKDDPAARACASRLGYSPKYVEKLLRAKTGRNIEVAELLRELRSQGAHTRALRYFEPIRRAMEDSNPQPLTLKLVESERDALHAEDVAEIRFWTSQGDADLSMAIRATERAIARLTVVRDAEVAEEQARMSRQS